MIRRGAIPRNESTVVCITGNGYKTADVVASRMAAPVRLGRGFKEFEGWWGLFRLIQSADDLTSGADETQYRLQWTLPTADGHSVLVQFDLRAPGHKNPFRPGLFKEFHCVEHL